MPLGIPPAPALVMLQQLTLTLTSGMTCRAALFSVSFSRQMVFGLSLPCLACGEWLV